MNIKKIIAILLLILFSPLQVFLVKTTYAETNLIVFTSEELTVALEDPEITVIQLGGDIVTNNAIEIMAVGERKSIYGDGFTWYIESAANGNVTFNMKVDIISDVNIISDSRFTLIFPYGGIIENNSTQNVYIESNGITAVTNSSFNSINMTRGDGSILSNVEIVGSGISVSESSDVLMDNLTVNLNDNMVGIWLYKTDGIIKNTTISGGHTGIHVRGYSSELYIEDTQIIGSSENGIFNDPANAPSDVYLDDVTIEGTRGYSIRNHQNASGTARLVNKEGSVLTIRNENQVAIHQKKGIFENYGILDFNTYNYAVVADYYSVVSDYMNELFMINPGSLSNKYYVLRSDYNDIIPPEISLLGEAKVVLQLGDTYVESGVYSIDEFDGEISDYLIEGEVVTNHVGEYSITYTVHDKAGNGSSVSRTVVVLPKDINKININLQKTDYVYTGNSIVPIFTILDNDKELTQNTDYSYTIDNNIEIGSATINIKGINNYSGEVILNFSIIPEKLESIEITKLPNKLSYFTEETLDLTGLEVTGTYNNGNKKIETITTDNISGYDSSNPEEGQLVTVNVDGKQTTFSVDIIAIMLESIEITRHPNKLSYFTEEALDLTGLEVTGTYNNGTKKTETVTIENMYSL